jgi:hypothetical protein
MREGERRKGKYNKDTKRKNNFIDAQKADKELERSTESPLVWMR